MGVMLRLLVLGVLLLGCSLPAAAATGSGLYGKVTRGPITPVCIANQPCYAPAAGVTLTFTRNANIVARIKTGPAGLYRIALAPGTYTVRELRPSTTLKPPVMKPLVVRVLAQLWTRQNFTIDTAIR
jgi:hypothetical protein